MGPGRHPTGWQPTIFDELSETQQLWLEGGQKSISALVQLWPSWPLRLRWYEVNWSDLKWPEVSILVLPGTAWYCLPFSILLLDDQIWPGKLWHQWVARSHPDFFCPKTVIRNRRFCAGDLFHNDVDKAFDEYGLLILFALFNLMTTCWTSLGQVSVVPAQNGGSNDSVIDALFCSVLIISLLTFPQGPEVNTPC